MNYLMEMHNFTIVSFHFLLIKKNILYMYKITIVPFIKMLNSQSAFITSSWIKNINVTKFSINSWFLGDLGIIMHEVW